MDKSKPLFSIMAITEYVLLILATVAVLTFQFLPYTVCIIIALVSYCLAFLISSIRAVINCIEIFSASKKVNAEGTALVTNNSVEVLSTKKEKTLAILSAILWISIFTFALVVLIMFPKI